MANLYIWITSHGNYSQGGRKLHIVNFPEDKPESTGEVLCGRVRQNLFGRIGMKVDLKWLSQPGMLTEVCLRCAKKAMEIFEKELEDEEKETKD